MTFFGDSIVTIAASLRNLLDLFHRIAGPKALVGLQGREVARVPAMSLDEQVGGICRASPNSRFQTEANLIARDVRFGSSADSTVTVSIRPLLGLKRT